MKRIALLLLFLPIIGRAGSNYSVSTASSLNAILKSSTVRPGDTITIAAGTYLNPTNGADGPAFVCTLTGTATNPIIVQGKGRVTIDGQNTLQHDVLTVASNFVWYIGLEIMSSDPGRVDRDPQTDANNLGSYPGITWIKRGQGINISSSGNPNGNKFINCIVHDCNGGFGSTNVNDNSQCYGCLFYNNGWFNSGGGGRSHHGHNIYVHNATGEIKQFYDCITWGAFENNIQAWSGSSTSDQEINDFYFNGHVSFLYGPQVDGSSLLLGNQSPKNPTVVNTMIYQPSSVSPGAMFGYSQGAGMIQGGNISDNYIAAGEVYFNASASGLTFNNNRVFSGFIRGSAYPGTGNTVDGSQPGVNLVFVRPVQYGGHTNVVIYNWTQVPFVTVDLSSVLGSGAAYTIVDAQNPFVTLLSGNYSGPVAIPMTGAQAAQPIGNDTEGRTHTPVEFGCFIVTGGSGGVVNPPPPPPSDSTFHVGDTVMVVNTTDCVNARSIASTSGNQPIKCENKGMKGIIVDGPSADVNKSSNNTFWKVAFTDGVTGWAAKQYLTKTGGIITPPPPPSFAGKYDTLRVPAQNLIVRKGTADTSFVSSLQFLTTGAKLDTATATITTRVTRLPGSVEK